MKVKNILFMDKKFVMYQRSTTSKFDYCLNKDFSHKTDLPECNNCRVFMITDRFINENFQINIMNDTRPYPYGVYPFILIADTAGCNLRCWFCYSWKFWEGELKEDVKPVYISEEQLADQITCKLRGLTKYSELVNEKIKEKWKRPFSRLRFSGGEPLWANRRIFHPFDEKKAYDYTLGILLVKIF